MGKLRREVRPDPGDAVDPHRAGQPGSADVLAVQQHARVQAGQASGETLPGGALHVLAKGPAGYTAAGVAALAEREVAQVPQHGGVGARVHCGECRRFVDGAKTRSLLSSLFTGGCWRVMYGVDSLHRSHPVSPSAAGDSNAQNVDFRPLSSCVAGGVWQRGSHGRGYACRSEIRHWIDGGKRQPVGRRRLWDNSDFYRHVWLDYDGCLRRLDDGVRELACRAARQDDGGLCVGHFAADAFLKHRGSTCIERQFSVFAFLLHWRGAAARLPQA